MNVFQRDEFFAKAKEAGLVEEIDRKLEERRHEQRLKIIEKIKAYPTIDQTDLPALAKACEQASKELQLAEEALREADRKYKDLSMRAYGAQNKYEGGREQLVREAQAMMSAVARTAWEDLNHLDQLVRNKFQVWIDHESGWTGPRAIERSNVDVIQASRANIKAGLDRILEMQLEDTDPEEADAEIFALVGALEAEALNLGVDRKDWGERRTPRSADEKAEDAKVAADKKVKTKQEARRAQLATLQP
jgi:hypothetical protein